MRKIRNTKGFISLLIIIFFIILTFSTLNLMNSNNLSSSNIYSSSYPNLTLFNEKRMSHTSKFIPSSPIDINGDTELELNAINGSGTLEDPFIFSDLNITYFSGSPIHIIYTTKYFIIRDCWLKTGSNYPCISVDHNAPNTVQIISNFCFNGDAGISIFDACGTIVVNNTCYTDYEGMKIYNSHSSIIIDNTFYGWAYGLRMTNISHSVIRNNICSNCEWGIAVYESEGIKIEDNTCLNTGTFSYFISSSPAALLRNNIGGNAFIGLVFENSNNSEICYNNISECSLTSISIFNSNHSMIHHNRLEDSQWIFQLRTYYVSIYENLVFGGTYGLFCINCTNCFFFRNNVTQNDIGALLNTFCQDNVFYLNLFTLNTNNAFDDGLGNQWYNQTMDKGNYWDDYSGFGSYPINGNASAFDPYPLINPDLIAPIINHPSDITYREGETGNQIVWNIIENYPSHYIIYRNQTQLVNLPLESPSISLTIDDLLQGYYNFTIVVYDSNSFFSIDTVFVKVTEMLLLSSSTTSESAFIGVPLFNTLFVLLSSFLLLVLKRKKN